MAVHQGAMAQVADMATKAHQDNPVNEAKMKTIKILSIIAVLAMMAGCVNTQLDFPDGTKIKTTRVFYPVETVGSYNPETGLFTFGYNSDGGKATAEAIVGAAVSAAIKEIK